MFMKNRMWRDHWYAIVAVLAIVVACFSAAVYQFSTSEDHIYRIEVTNEPLLSQVFQSGEPWVVLCAKPDHIMPELFSEAPKRLAGKSYMGVMDCTQKLPSGKSVLTRFGIKTSISPTIFTVSNGEKPQQIFLNYLQSTKAFAKRVVEQTKKSVVEVLKSSQLESKCLHKSECVLLLRGAKWTPYERQWLDRLMKEYRKLPFVWVDSTILKLSMESALPKYKTGEHRLVLFKKIRDPDTKISTLMAKAYRSVFDLIPVRQFLEHALSTDLKPLAVTPTLSRRARASSKPSKRAGSTKSTESSEQESYAQKSHRQRAESEKDRGDDYYFPQAADDTGEEEQDNSPTTYEVDEIVDLDDMDE